MLTRRIQDIWDEKRRFDLTISFSFIFNNINGFSASFWSQIHFALRSLLTKILLNRENKRKSNDIKSVKSTSSRLIEELFKELFFSSTPVNLKRSSAQMFAIVLLFIFSILHNLLFFYSFVSWWKYKQSKWFSQSTFLLIIFHMRGIKYFFPWIIFRLFQQSFSFHPTAWLNISSSDTLILNILNDIGWLFAGRL